MNIKREELYTGQLVTLVWWCAGLPPPGTLHPIGPSLKHSIWKEGKKVNSANFDDRLRRGEGL